MSSVRTLTVIAVLLITAFASSAQAPETIPPEASAAETPAIETPATESVSADTSIISTTVTADQESDFYSFLYFLGRFHPVVLHFPIGLLVVLLLLELVTAFRPLQGEPAKAMLLILGAIGSVIAAVFGLFLSWSASFDPELVFWHQWTGIGVAVGAVLAVVLRSLLLRRRSAGYAFLYGLVLFLTVGALAPAGHYGAALTHGPNYLVTYLPEELEFLRPILGEPEAATAADAGEGYFAASIFPILEAKCLECHSGGKQDGELSLETREYALAGGESGKPAIVPGDAMASYMVELMLLPSSHADVMPPEGEPQLTPEELVALVQWVNNGATWGDVDLTQVAVRAADSEKWEPDQPTSGAAGGAAVPLVNAKEIMELLFEPPYLTLQEGLTEEPKGRSALRELYNASFTIAEAHNLLYSRNDEEYMATPDWSRLSTEGRDAALALGKAMQARDYPMMKETFATLVNTCNVCHEHFELKVDPMTIEPVALGERRR